MKVRLVNEWYRFRTKRQDTRDISILSDNLSLDYLQCEVNVFARNSFHILYQDIEPGQAEIRKYTGRNKYSLYNKRRNVK